MGLGEVACKQANMLSPGGCVVSKDTVPVLFCTKQKNDDELAHVSCATHRLRELVELAAHAVFRLLVVEVHLWLGKNMIRVI